MLVSFRFRSSQKGVLHNGANFGIGTLEAGGDAGRDHLEEYPCSVMRPQHQHAEQDREAESRPGDDRAPRELPRRVQLPGRAGGESG